MKKINRMLASARSMARNEEREAIESVMQRLSMPQLLELVYCEPSETRVHEILASVGGLHLLKDG
jgi:hypothetical protein